MSGDFDTERGIGRPGDTARLVSIGGTRGTGAADATDDGAGLDDGTGGMELVSQFLAELRHFADEPAPPPSAELAAVFAGATSLTATALAPRRPDRGRRRRNALLAAAVSVAAVSVTGVAAANDTLPQPAQRVVSSWVNDLTPFHIDESHAHPSHAVVPPATKHRDPSTHPAPSSSAPEPEDSRSAQPGGEPGDSTSAPEGRESTDSHQEQRDGSTAPAGERSGDQHESGSTETRHRDESPSPTSDGEHHSESESSQR